MAEQDKQGFTPTRKKTGPKQDSQSDRSAKNRSETADRGRGADYEIHFEEGTAQAK